MWWCRVFKLLQQGSACQSVCMLVCYAYVYRAGWSQGAFGPAVWEGQEGCRHWVCMTVCGVMQTLMWYESGLLETCNLNYQFMSPEWRSTSMGLPHSLPVAMVVHSDKLQFVHLLISSHLFAAYLLFACHSVVRTVSIDASFRWCESPGIYVGGHSIKILALKDIGRRGKKSRN